ncbi:toxin glutamine deamidase domain-containing protein, partial [Nocardia amamiensis]|uniref:toxin glutamine deamidase domain-containing protein n=1 Tax=Nocardia amamiensis TaxID=404578 RepID=UPI0034057F84
MGIEIPGWLQWAAQWLVGAGDWPDGDETAMRRVADAWSGMSAALNELDDDAAHTMQLALAAIDGKTHDAIAAHWNTLAGKEGAWQALVKYIDLLADQIGDGAADIEHTKLVIIGSMVIFAIEVAPLLATAWTGFSAGGAVVLRVATQITIRMAIKQLIARMLTRGAAKAAARVALFGALFEAAEEGGLEIGVKLLQLADGRRDEVTLREDWKAAGIAALAGAAGGAVGGGLGRSGLLSGVDDVATSRLGRATIAATTETATGIAGETAAAATVAALTDQPFQLTLESITSSAAQGVPHGLHSAAGTRPTDTDSDTTPPDINDPGPTPPVPSDSQPERTQPTQSDTGEQTQPSSTQPEPEATQPASAHANANETDSDSPTSDPVENTTPAPTSSTQAQNAAAPSSEVGTEDSSLSLPSPDSADPVSDNPQPQTQAAPRVGAEATPTPSHTSSPSDSSSSLANSDPVGPHTLSSNPVTSLNDTAPTVSAEQDPTGTATTSPTPTAPSHIPSEIGGQPTAPSNPAPAAHDAVDQSGSQPSIQNQSSVDNTPPIFDHAAPAPGQRVDTATPDTATPSTTSPLAAAPTSTHTPRPDAQANSPTDTVTSSAVTTASPAAVPSSTLAGAFAHTTDAGQRSSVPTPDPATPVGPSQSAPVATPRPEQTTRATAPPQSVSPVVSPPTATSGPSSTSAPPADLVHRASPPDRASSVGTAHPAPISDRATATGTPRRDDTSDEAQPSRPSDPSTSRQSDAHDPGPMNPESISHSGGAVRPRDDFAAFDWAEDAYDHFRRDDRDIDDIAHTLGEHPRADGSHFTRDDVEQIKNHLFREEHPIIDYDGNLIHRRFDADPDIAEAWIRLRAGHPLPADIVLLEHELAESDYLRAHPESTYQDAHAHANLDHHWSNDIPPRTGERYDTLWGRHDGTADLLQPDQRQPERSGVPVRGDEGQPRPHTDHRQDEQHRPHGPTGGRDLPSDRGTDHGPGQTREAVAPERRDRLVTDDSGPREAHTHPNTPRPQESDRGPAPDATQRTENPSTTATPPHVGNRNQPTRHPTPDRAVGETAADNRPQSPSRPPDPGAFFRRRRHSGADTPRRGDSWDQAMRELAASTAPQPESAARRGTLPVQDRPYYANPDFRDRDAADEYARNNPNYLHEVAGIRARAVHAHPEVARLTDAEIAAIRHNQFLSLNEHVNRATRDGDTRALEEYDAAIRALVGAYNRLPDYNGVVYRSLSIADPVLLQRFLDEYQIGNTPPDRGFASSDKESSMPGGNIEFVIESRHGKDISWASGQQDEVVFPPGHRFRVDNRTFENGKHIIYLTDLGRNSDGHQSRGNGTDSTRGPRSYAEARELGSRDSGTGGTQHGRLAREGSEGPTPSHRGADQDLASLGRIGTEADRSGTRRDDGVSREAEQTRPYSGGEHQSRHPSNRSAAPRLPSTPPHAESAPPMWAHQDPNYIANSHRLPDWWPRAEHSVPPHAPETRAQVADLSSMRAPESLPPPPHLAPAPTHGAEPRPLTSPPQPRPTHFTPAPHDQGRPGPYQRQESEHTTGTREPRQRPDPRFEPNTGSEPRRQDPHNPVPPHDPHSSARRTELPDQRRPVDPETQRALETRNARENYRRRAPEDNRVIAVRPDRTTGVPAYETRRYAEGAEHVAVVSVRVHLEAGAHISPQEMRDLIENAHLATDRAFNFGRRLLSRDWLMVDVVFTNDPSTAHLSVNVDRNTGDPRTWHPHDRPETLANRVREHLGLPADSQSSPTVRPEDLRQISNDIAAANTPARFTGLPETRVIAHNQLTNLEDPIYQAMVEDSLREGDRFTVGADPRTHPYGRLINDGGPTFPGRGTNCLDSALAALSSFFGNPQVSLPRYPDRLPDGTIDQTSGERDGIQRATDWLGDSWQNHSGMPVPDQFMALHNQISALGPGSAALVVNEWHARDANTNALLYNQDGTPVIDGTHATVIVYPPGASGPVWWDPQQGPFSDRPPADMIHNSTRLWSMPIPPNQGVNSAGIPNQGASRSVSGTDLQSRPGVPDLPVRARLGLSADPDTPADGERAGTGLGELRGERQDRSSDSPRQPRADDDRGDVRRGDPQRPTGTGLPGVSPTVASDNRTDTGRLAGDRVPASSDISDRAPGTEHRTPTRDQQEHPVVQSDGQHVGERSVLGRDAQPDGRNLAATGDIRVLDAADRDGTAAPVQTSTQVTTPNTHRQSTRSPVRESAPVDPGSSRDRSPERASHHRPDVPRSNTVETTGSNQPGSPADPVGEHPTETARPGSRDLPLRDLTHSREWAAEEYNAIRHADDIALVVAHLEHTRRPDGTRYTRADIEAVKQHLFHDEHLLAAMDGGLVRSRFEPSARIAEAWIRMRSGRHTDSDLLLLEHELAEHRYLQEHPDASYVDAHNVANEVANWERDRNRPEIDDHQRGGSDNWGDRNLPDVEYLGGRHPIPGQTGAEILPPRRDITGPNGEPIFDIPPGSNFGPGTDRPVPESILTAFNIGVNADPSKPPPMCSYCRAEHATSVDHVIPRKRGGDRSPENFVPSCTHCNSSKNDGVVPLTPSARFEGLYPPPWWPEHLRAAFPDKPRSYYPRIEERVLTELNRTRENLLSRVDGRVREYAESQGITGRWHIRRIAERERQKIENDMANFEQDALHLIRWEGFNPRHFEAWMGDGEKMPIDVKGVYQQPERMTFIRGDRPDEGILIKARSPEHAVAYILQHAEHVVSVEDLKTDVLNRLESGRAAIFVNNEADALAFGLGHDVRPWAPDDDSVLAERLAETTNSLPVTGQAASQKPDSPVPPRVHPPAMWDPRERAEMTLAAREDARNEAARDRQERKEAIEYRELVRKGRQPIPRDEFDRQMDARQAARDELERKLDVREHNRDLRERNGRTLEEFARDEQEREWDEQVRANLEREWLRDERAQDRYDRMDSGQDTPERVHELDERIRQLDEKEALLDRNELARLERERALAREGRGLDAEELRQKELDDRTRVILETNRARAMRGLELGIEAPERVRELDTRLLEL